MVVVANAPNGYLVDIEESLISQHQDGNYDGITVFTPTGRCQIAESGLTGNPWAGAWNVEDYPARHNLNVESLGYWRATRDEDSGAISVTTPKGNPWTRRGTFGHQMNLEGPQLKTVATYSSFSMTLKYRCHDIHRHNPLLVSERGEPPTWPARSPNNQHYGNSGIYIFNRWEVQIVDPSRWGVGQGHQIHNEPPTGALISHWTQITPGGPYNMRWGSPLNGSPEYDPNGQDVYGFVYHDRNRSRVTHEWNTMQIVFHAPTFAPDGKTLARPAHLTVWLNHDDQHGGIVFEGWRVDPAGNPIKGTGSRGVGADHPAVIQGCIWLQSHWGSQVEFRCPIINPL